MEQLGKQVLVRVLTPTTPGKCKTQYFGPFESKEIAKEELAKKKWVLIGNIEDEVYTGKDRKRRATIFNVKDLQSAENLPDA